MENREHSRDVENEFKDVIECMYKHRGLDEHVYHSIDGYVNGVSFMRVSFETKIRGRAIRVRDAIERLGTSGRALMYTISDAWRTATGYRVEVRYYADDTIIAIAPN